MMLTRTSLVSAALAALVAAGCGGQKVTVEINPMTTSVVAGEKTQFTATVKNATNTEVEWSVEQAAGGSISATGEYTAPATAGSFTVVATSKQDPTVSAKAGVTVTAAVIENVAISITPTNPTLSLGGTQAFTALVTGTTNTAVTWSVQESSGGTISAAGLYTAPSTAGTYHVVATSQADTTKTATATVTVQDGQAVTISITPATASVSINGTVQFNAEVSSGLASWSVQEGTAGGTVSSSGLYTAPSAPGTFHVIATSQADSTKTATATVTVHDNQSVTVTITPTTASVLTDGTFQFNAVASSGSVTWSVLEGNAGGTVNSTGLYTAPSVPGVFRVVATSALDASKTATATVTVSAPGSVSVTVSPATAEIVAGETQLFTATVTGTANTAVNWSVPGTDCGTVDGSGLYTAPAALPPSFCTVEAVSVADATKKGSAIITVKPAGSVTISPTTATVLAGASRTFTATTMNLTPGTLTWTVVEANGGTVAPTTASTKTGRYTAPALAGTYTVKATSDADPTKFATAVVTVPVDVKVSPTNATVYFGETLQFNANVTGVPAGATVNWSVPAAAGTISTTGLFTASSTAGTYTLRVELASDPTKFATTDVTLEQKPQPLISGTVTYAGTKTGRIFILVTDANSGDAVAGTSIAAPGAFTVNGVPPGDYYVDAFMDTSGQGLAQSASDPFFYAPNVNAVGGQTNVALALEQPTPATLTAPNSVSAFPADGSAIVTWSSVSNASGTEVADAYKIYWSTTTSPKDMMAGGSLMVPAGAETLAIVKGLTNGATLYFGVAGMHDGVEGPLNALTTPVVVNAAVAVTGTTGGISGSATFTGSSTAVGPLYALAVGSTATVPAVPQTYLVRVAAPTANQTFNLAGVLPGSYRLYAFYDIGDDGIVLTHEPFVTGDLVTVTADATATASPIKSKSEEVGALVSVTTESSTAGLTFELSLTVRGGSKSPVKVALSGGPLTGVVDLPLTGRRGFEFRAPSVDFGSTKPTVGMSYSALLTFADGSTQTITPTLTQYFESLPAVVSPADSATGVSRTPTFTWTAPTGPGPASYTYVVLLYDFLEQRYTWQGEAPQSATSLVFTPAFGLNQLQGSRDYAWYVYATDENDHVAFSTYVSFVTAN